MYHIFLNIATWRQGIRPKERGSSTRQETDGQAGKQTDRQRQKQTRSNAQPKIWFRQRRGFDHFITDLQ